MSKNQKKDMSKKSYTPVVLCILDGWGTREPAEDNAIFKANTPNWDRIKKSYPQAQLNASAGDVGLPKGQMGNSEVGHMNLGAGRVVMQDLPKIDSSIADGSLKNNKMLQKFASKVKNGSNVCHLMGLVSPGGIHSHQNHLIELSNILIDNGLVIRLHAFLDGRDTPPSSSKLFLREVIDKIENKTKFSVATISGRYFPMDRDNNWERIEKSYLAISESRGYTSADCFEAIDKNYKEGITDEFIEPTCIEGYKGVCDGDGLLVCNFRADRIRQILSAFLDPDFTEFSRPKFGKLSASCGLVEYSDKLSKLMTNIFSKTELNNILGEVISNNSIPQLRIAETEKYAHVTFFFNGGREELFSHEDRILIPSPKVPTYDMKPEMSAMELTDKLLESIASGKYGLIVANYANGDMVGHTGVFAAGIKAAEVIDECLGKLEQKVIETGATLVKTADHGNLERMLNEEQTEPHTAHTLSPVPIIFVSSSNYVKELKNGSLADVAPTVLDFMDIKKPSEMRGSSLIIKT